MKARRGPGDQRTAGGMSARSIAADPQLDELIWARASMPCALPRLHQRRRDKGLLEIGTDVEAAVAAAEEQPDRAVRLLAIARARTREMCAILGNRRKRSWPTAGGNSIRRRRRMWTDARRRTR